MKRKPQFITYIVRQSQIFSSLKIALLQHIGTFEPLKIFVILI